MKSFNLASRVQLHAARHHRKSDAWCIVLNFFSIAEIEERLLRTRTTDLDEAVRLFEDIGTIILARLKAVRYAREQLSEAA